MKHVLLIGSGGIASLYGLMLQKAGYRITLLCRSSYDSVKESGIYVETKWGSSRFQPNNVINTLDGFSETTSVNVTAKAQRDLLA